MGGPLPACYLHVVPRRSELERIIDQHAGHATVGTVSIAVERMAEELAREVLADDEFRQSFRALVRLRSRQIRDRLQRQRAVTRRASVKRRRRR